MHSSCFQRLFLVIGLVLLAAPARAQFTRDEAAGKKIREAIDQHYLATNFDKAEGVLTGTIQACQDKCSPQLLARAWMYVGIVRGSGKNNLAGAKEAFGKAIALDPGVKLDTELATPDTQKAFQESGGGAAVAAPAEPAEPAQPAGEAAEPAGLPEGTGLDCTPKVTEIETRRAIPVQCRTEEDAATVELRYRPAGEDWQSLKMTRKGDSFRAEIPCSKTEVSGALRLFVRAKDKSGDDVAGWGTKANPIQIGLVEKSAQEPPSFDDADAPPRCGAKEDCPPNFPGCATGKGRGNVDWGGSCNNSMECKQGLLCVDGSCETAPSCQTDSDCSTGTCVSGKCDVGSESDSPYRKNWIGLHIAQDFTFVGGEDVCTQASQSDDNFSCYYGGSRTGAYIDEPYPGTTADTKFVVATTRVLLSFDRAFTSRIMAGVRIGYAFGGGPPAGRNLVYGPNGEILRVTDEGLAFLPFHAELRASYWFGANPLARKGFRPYVHVGGGLAQVDAKTKTTIKDCGLFAPRGSAQYDACKAGTISENTIPDSTEVELDAWKKYGQGFATIGGGAVYAFTEKFGAQLNLNLMYTLPASGIVIQPSLGATMGF